MPGVEDQGPPIEQQLQDTIDQLGLYEYDLSNPNSGLNPQERADLAEKVRRLKRHRAALEKRLGAQRAPHAAAAPPQASPPPGDAADGIVEGFAGMTRPDLGTRERPGTAEMVAPVP